MGTATSQYTEHTPCAALRPYVECFWSRVSSGPAEGADFHRVLPDGCMDIIFNFGQSWSGQAASGNGTRPERSYVVGTMSRPLLVQLSGRAEFLGVRFRPGKGPLFLRLSAGELTDRSTALENLWGRPGQELEARLAEQQGLRHKISVLEKELLRRLAFNGKENILVGAAIESVLRSGGTLSVEAVCALTGISRQYLARKFAQYVGVSPKLFSRVARFQNLIGRIQRSEPLRWSAAAQELGYYDQAHMISDFREFSGLSPEKYRLSP